mgnify:CR=1 FL=1
MIIGFDHIAYSTINIDAEIENFVNNNYSCKFINKQLKNNIAKKELLENFYDTHDIAFLTGDSIISIEIIEHSKCLPATAGEYKYRQNFIEVNAYNKKTEEEFWENVLRFKKISGNKMNLRSFNPSLSCTIEICQNKDFSKYYLDSKGYTCMAFYSNNLKEEIRNIEKFGGKEISDIFSFNVNNKLFNITLFRTAGGNLCELLELKR